MNSTHPWHRSGRRNRLVRGCERRAMGAAAAVLCYAIGGPRALGHSAWADYLRHDVSLTVGTGAIEVRIELTFYQMRSWLECRRMDPDRDGRVTREDLQTYLAGLEPMFEDGVRLSVAGKPVDLIPLYDPEIELPDRGQAGAASHVLRLFYFARSPSGLRAGDDLVVEDGLWPSAPAIRSFEAAGRDGFRIRADPLTEPVSAAVGAPGPHRLTARCLALPAPPPAAGDRPAPVPIVAADTGPAHVSKRSILTMAGILILAGVALAARARRNPIGPHLR